MRNQFCRLGLRFAPHAPAASAEPHPNVNLLLALVPCIAIAALDPPIEGDPKLIDLILNAQRSNLAQISSPDQGEIKVRGTRHSESPDGHKTTIVLNSRQLWFGQFIFWEYDIKFRDSGNKIQPGPTYIRMLFDGTEYTLYRPLESGGVTIFGAHDFHNVAPLYDDIDQRPHVRWASHHGMRPWEQLLGPHPKFPQAGILRWVLDRDGSRVTIERYDAGDGTGGNGKATFVASLELAGNVIEADYKGKRQRHRSKYDWREDATGVVLDREWQSSQYSDGTVVEKEFNVVAYDSKPTAALTELGVPNKNDLFEKALRIRKGTVIEDRIRRKTYTYGGQEITERLLNELGNTMQSRGFLRPHRKIE